MLDKFNEKPKAAQPIVYKSGMEVLVPGEFGDEVFKVDATRDVPLAERELAGHSQFVQIKDSHGTIYPYRSGIHLKPKPTEEA